MKPAIEAKKYNYLDDFVSDTQSKGKLHFSLAELRKVFHPVSGPALKQAMNRLVRKGKILPAHRGFYIIVPPDRMSQGVLPPELFIDSLMSYLSRFYYVGLLSAAVYHGSSHQQPQEFFVVITKSPMRSTILKGVKINYVVRSRIPKHGLEKRKTESGLMNISSPELTIFDLVMFQDRIGGLNRVATIISELADSLNPDKMMEVIRDRIPISVIQRSGYILDRVLNRKDLSDVLLKVIKDKNAFRVPLKSNGSRSGYPVDETWQIVRNIEIEAET